MTTRLKVYSWTGFRLATRSRRPREATREVVAAPSLAAAARAAGVSTYYLRTYGGQTFNDRATEAALSQPGVVFVRALDDWDGPYVPACDLEGS